MGEGLYVQVHICTYRMLVRVCNTPMRFWSGLTTRTWVHLVNKAANYITSLRRQCHYIRRRSPRPYNDTRYRWQEQYGMPGSNFTKCPKLVTTIKSRLPKQCKDTDCPWNYQQWQSGHSEISVLSRTQRE